MGITPQERAERATAAMWKADNASKWIGLHIEQVGPGSATLSLKVEDHHTNGHKICHGGIIFTLADSAFAFACNSYNQSAVAQHNTISFVAPAMLGDTLMAIATEVSMTGRSGIFDINVTNQDGTLIATFRGCSRTINGTHFDEEQASSDQE